MSRSWCGLAVVALLGCTSGTQGIEPGGDLDASTAADASTPPPLRANDFCGRAQASAIAYWPRCSGGTLAEWTHFWGEPRGCSAAEASALAGKLALDAAIAARCLDAIAGLSCDDPAALDVSPFEPWRSVAACEGVFAGRVTAGEPCSGIECAPGTACDDVGGDEGVCSRRCAAIQHLAEGARCTPGRTIVQCAPGTSCVGTRFTETCEASPREGARCHPWLGCGTALRCLRDRCATPAAAGDACDPPVGLTCGGLTYCSSGTCARLPPLGDSCTDRGCAWPATCLDGTCALPPVAGDACDADGAGCVRSWCDVAIGTCRELLPSGAACTEDRQCAEGRCRVGTCAFETSCP